MDDLISRQAAIDEVHNVMLEFFDLCDDDEESPITEKEKALLKINKKIANSIKALPSAQPEQRWIPCSERLPEEDASVLASIKNHSFEVAVGEIDGEVFWIVDGFIPLDDVIAWMPLPEPWKGEDDEAR